jgi:hypothetical protein
MGAGSLGLALRTAASQASTEPINLADHPLTGTWLATIPGGVAPSLFAGDGTVLLAWQVCESGADGGIEYTTSGVGTWEATGERSGYFNVVQVLSDEKGAFIGTRSVHGYPVVSDDGASFLDDGKRVRVFVRNASNEVTLVLGENGDSPAITGIRMGPGRPGFPGLDGSPAEQ